jgi:hypothetical protein
VSHKRPRRSDGEAELRGWAFDRNYDEALRHLEHTIALLQTNLKLRPKPSQVVELRSHVARLEIAYLELSKTVAQKPSA